MRKPHEDRDRALPSGAPSFDKNSPPLALVPPSPPRSDADVFSEPEVSRDIESFRNPGRSLNLAPVDSASEPAVRKVELIDAEPRLPVPVAGDLSAILSAAASAAARGIPGAMATVLERHGSAPGTPGQKLYVSADGSCVGTVGGGAVERAVLAALVALAVSSEAEHSVRTFKLGAELGMCCGGRLVVLLEPLIGLVPSLIVGAGHVATALVPLLARVGFAVTVVDERPEWGDGDRIAPHRPPNVRLITGDFDDAGQDVDRRGVCLAMTHDHALDQRVIEWALRRGFAFVGGIGSRAKAERTRQRLEAKGFSHSDRDRIRMPLGLAIGSRSPDEIAVAVAAELIAWRRGPR